MDILITKRLTLRPPLEVDAEAITEALQDKTVTRNLTGVPHPYHLADAHKWISENCVAADRLVLTIHRQKLIGSVGLRPADGALELGYWLLREQWGQGIITEAARATLAYGFRQFGCESVTAGAYEDNPASLAVLAKLGFEKTGEVKEHFCPTRDETAPCERLVLTRTRFENRFGGLDDAEAA